LEGVESNSSWEANAAAAQGNHDAGVQRAVAAKSFSKGVRRAGQAKYKKGAVEKGAVRYPQGVGLAGEDWQKGYSPFGQVVQGLTLPPRRPRGDPANFERSRVVGMALAAKRAALKGGT
jgi:hypothetical protein